MESLVAGRGGRLCGQPLGPGPQLGRGPAAAFLRGRVWACGGGVVGRPGGDCWEADPARPTSWTRSPGLPHNTSHAAAAARADKLWLVGGERAECGQPAVQVFSARTRRWAVSRAAPPVPPGGHGCAVSAAGRVFLTGGRATRCGPGPGPAVQALNTRSGRWRAGPRLLVARSSHACRHRT